MKHVYCGGGKHIVTISGCTASVTSSHPTNIMVYGIDPDEPVQCCFIIAA